MNRHLSDPVSYLVKRRYPLLDALRNGSLNLPDEERRGQLDEIVAYDIELRQMPSDQIEELVRDEKHKELLEAQFGRHVEDQGSFFAHPDADADFEHWAKLSYWEIEEGVALLCGKEPEKVPVSRIFGLRSSRSPFVSRFIRLLDIGLRARATLHLRDRNAPVDFMTWAKGRDIPYPPELDELVSRYSGNHMEKTQAKEPKEPSDSRAGKPRQAHLRQ